MSIVTVYTIDVLIEIAKTHDHRSLALRWMSPNVFFRKNGWHSYFAEEYAMSQLCHSSRTEVNKFLVACIILFKRVYFRQYCVCLRERLFNCCNAL